MNFDELKALLEDMDLTKILPQSEAMAASVQKLLQLAMMIGPLVLLGFGLLYLFAPPKEANYSLGYRFWWSMASLDAWLFTHKLVGFVWTGLGFVLTVIMALICNGFRRMEPMDMVWSAVGCLIWEVVLTAIACLAINILVVITFDEKGFRRKENAK